MKIQRNDIFTPANAITSLGILLTAGGALYLNTLPGLTTSIVGKLLDIIDGPVARKTHTSAFGAMFDAGADKLTGFILMGAAYHYDLVPVAFLIFVFTYHLLVALMAFDAIRHGLEPTPSRIGKYTMFTHISALLLFVLSKVITNYSHTVFYLAVFCAVVGVISGITSFTIYVRDYVQKVFKPSHK